MFNQSNPAPPALFIGPPSTASVNSSDQASVYRPAGLHRQPSPSPPASASGGPARSPAGLSSATHKRVDSRVHLSPTAVAREAGSSTFQSQHSPLLTQTQQSQPAQELYPSTQFHTLLWLSASQKLSNIESLNSEESSVFGQAHSKALDGLRAAQMGLAQAWMRTESEDLLDGEHAELARRSFGRDGTADQRSGSLRDGGMENDLLLARKRRELNDAHFNRVSMSVVDVISRLDKVAEAMGVVENESRDIWGSEVSDASSNR
ncbi:hypothetical protein DFH27DRAFT_476706 [Peziza echinospora]|nr:hypothetical protein DFH27DRAFT_476706 [Peziza echinospora]